MFTKEIRALSLDELDLVSGGEPMVSETCNGVYCVRSYDLMPEKTIAESAISGVLGGGSGGKGGKRPK